MRFAYADPPYLGNASQYRKYHAQADDYDDPETHRRLIVRLHDEYPDGWALSASMKSLWDLIPMIPKKWGCRIGVWCSPFGSFGAKGWPRTCWEPVFFSGGRRRRTTFGRKAGGVCPPADFIVTNRPFAAAGHAYGNQYHRRQRVFPGAKPDEFCYWLFELLNMRPGDEFVDMFPGTGRVTRAWKTWSAAGVRLFQ